MGRVALVTGGGTGIGRGVALALARRGVDIAVVGRRPEPLLAVVEQAQALGVRAAAFPADLAAGTDLPMLEDRIHATFGPIGVLVNNAGTFAGGEVSRLHGAHIEQAVMLNLVVPMLLVRQYIPDLARTRGAIIFIGSALGLVPMPGASVYSATKAGLTAFGQAVRYEVAPHGIRVLIACPPGTKTGMTSTMRRAAGLPAYPLADPLVVGERIVRALASGQHEVQWGSGERALIMLQRWTPHLARKLVMAQRRRLIRIFETAHG